MHQKQPLGGVPFWDCFGTYVANLQEAGTPMPKYYFNKDAIAAALSGSRFCMRCYYVNFLRTFGTPYHGMVSEGVFLIHHGLQIDCIVNVNVCIKGPDDKTIVIYRSLQILK